MEVDFFSRPKTGLVWVTKGLFDDPHPNDSLLMVQTKCVEFTRPKGTTVKGKGHPESIDNQNAQPLVAGVPPQICPVGPSASHRCRGNSRTSDRRKLSPGGRGPFVRAKGDSCVDIPSITPDRKIHI